MGTCPKCGSRVKVLSEPREGVQRLVCTSVDCGAPPYEQAVERPLAGLLGPRKKPVVVSLSP